jgi:hypothetical protein
MRAAIATLLQVHIVDVPDPRIRWDNRREFDLNPGGVEANDEEPT